MDMVFQKIKGYLRNTDWCLLALSCICTLYGMVLIFSATHSTDSSKFLIVQGAAFILGLIGFVIASVCNIDNVGRMWKLMYAANLLLIGSLAIFGIDGGTGNKSWIRFFGIGIQPAEIGKVLLILTLAQHIKLLDEDISSVKSVIQLCLHIFIPTAAVYVVSKDMGMALAYILIGFSMLFIAGVHIKWFAAGALACAAGFPLIWNFLGEFQRNRILVVFNPSVDEAVSWQAEQSKIAIGGGQLIGRGFLKGTQTQFSRLPAKHTDCIFAVAGEEFGFIGCMLIIILLTAIVLRVFFICWRASSRFSSLVCAGVGAMLLFQSVINIGMCLGVTPVIGLTLPFFSYGGSSVVTMFISIGIIAGIRMRVGQQTADE